MKKVVLVLMICLPALMNSYSQTKQESIKELFHLMQQDSLMDKMFGSMIPSMMNQMKGQFPIKDSLANVRSNEMMKSTMQTVKDITKKMMDEDMVALYDKYYSQNEINDYISFYKSPSGQKMIKVTPDITKDLMMIMMQKYMPEIQKTIKAKTEEMKKTDILSLGFANAQDIQSIKGKWEGTYFCGQGESGVTMEIKPISDKEFIGTFKFYSIKLNPSPLAKSGKFTFIGKFISTDSIIFTQDKWIKQPKNYMMIDLAGKLVDKNTIEGVSTTYSCGAFKIKKK